MPDAPLAADRPPYLPHMQNPEVLQMGLAPLGDAAWIETDADLGRFHEHKQNQRRIFGDRVYDTLPSSEPAQRELKDLLLQHLTREQPDHYRISDNLLQCISGGFDIPLNNDEDLWTASLWIADDLVIMEEIDGRYTLTAASLCSASQWRLEEKFGLALTGIHDPIPGFHDTLTPRIDRFLSHLKPEHPVVRYNWALQVGDALNLRPELETAVTAHSQLYYRTERQSLRRLPRTGAIAFTIRVYVHPLESLAQTENALQSLLSAIDNAPAAIGDYKGFHTLAPALERYRAMC